MKKITLRAIVVMLLAFGFVSTAQISTFPYEEDFESGAGGWTATGDPLWEVGTPAGDVIIGAASGTNAWATDLDADYTASLDANVESPVFDFSGEVVDPTITMDIWIDSEFSWDGTVLQSTIDGGATWQNVGALDDPNNWYNDDTINGTPAGQQVGWTGTGTSGTGGYVEASNVLSGLVGQAAVQLRFAFGSDGSVFDDGFAFDNVSITFPPPPELNCQDATVNLDPNGMLAAPFGDLVQDVIERIDGNGNFTGTLAALDTPIDIPTPGEYTSVINVNGIGGIHGEDYVASVNINITHTFNADLDIFLVAPDGQELELSTDNGGSANGYLGVTFEDGGDTLPTGNAIITGTFAPEGGMFIDSFSGSTIDGDWTLRVVDDAGGDVGTLTNFEIQFEEIEPQSFVIDEDGNEFLISYGPNMFDCDDIGDNMVTVSIDYGGTPITCMATLTVLSGIDFDGPVDIFTGTGVGDEACETIVNYDISATVVGCTGDAELEITSGFESGEAFPVGTTVVTYDAVAMDGTVLDTYTFEVTITDTTIPAIECPDDFAVDPDDTGMFTIPDWTGLASDNCSSGDGLVTTQEPAEGTVVEDGSTTEVTITATDEAGNVSECVFNVTVDATLGTDNLALDSALSVFPNPATNVFTLRNTSGAVLNSMSIIDVNGRVVSQLSLDGMGAEREVSIANLASGVYFVQISTDAAAVVKRIVKK